MKEQTIHILLDSKNALMGEALRVTYDDKGTIKRIEFGEETFCDTAIIRSMADLLERVAGRMRGVAGDIVEEGFDQ